MLDHKADLMVRLDDPVVRSAWRDQTMADMRWEGQDLTNRFPNARREQINRSNALAIIDTLWHAVPEAECFHVNKDMTALVQFAATQLDQTDRFHKLMLPTRSGLVRFEGGIPWTDVRGKQLRLSWAAWGPILAQPSGPSRHDVGEPDEHTHFWMWNDQLTEPDEIAEDCFRDFSEDRIRGLFGRWGFMGGEYIAEGQRLGPAMRIPGEEKMAEVLSEGDVPHEYTNPVRLMHALWMLLGQTVTRAEVEIPDRARRKRAERAGIPARVTVVQLRNIESGRSEGESLVEWQHRWVVRGHPAWRHCGPNHPLAEEHPDRPGEYRCRVWIAPYTKGPDGAPLIITDKVYALHR